MLRGQSGLWYLVIKELGSCALSRVSSEHHGGLQDWTKPYLPICPYEASPSHWTLCPPVTRVLGQRPNSLRLYMSGLDTCHNK
jgi:hypothetical protein